MSTVETNHIEEQTEVDPEHLRTLIERGNPLAPLARELLRRQGTDG